jgi:hypothetical protein
MITKFNPAWNLGFDSTFYPDAGTGATTVDGFVKHAYAGGAGQVWATIKAAAGTAHDDTGDYLTIDMTSDSGSPNWINLSRIIALFDTSSIEDTDTVGSATLSAYVFSTVIENQYGAKLNVYSSTPTADNDLANGDFASTHFGTTPFSTSVDITAANFPSSAYKSFTLNGDGIAAISKTGITKLAFRESEFDAGAGTPTYATSKSQQLNFYSADRTGTNEDPKLVVSIVYIVTIADQANLTLAGQVPTIEAIIQVLIANSANLTLSGQVPVISVAGGYIYQDKNTSSWTYQSKS